MCILGIPFQFISIKNFVYGSSEKILEWKIYSFPVFHSLSYLSTNVRKIIKKT